MREKELIKKNYVTILYHCGVSMILGGVLLLLPLLILPFFPEEFKYIHLFLKPCLISISLGLIVVFIFKNIEKTTITINCASVIVVFGWIWVSFLGAFPFYIFGKFTYLHGLFESVSGWTTTGLTVVNVEEVPKMILMWRSIMQYIGGAGLAVVMISILSGPSASGVYRSEGHLDEIRPQVTQTTIMVMKIYLTYLLVGTILYKVAGMNWFDSINHCMTALGTGGFSTKSSSIGFFNSVPIEIITIILMLIGNTNFATHNQLFLGHIKIAIRNAEVRTSFVIMCIFIPIVFYFVTVPVYTVGGWGGFFDIFHFKAWWAKFGTSIRYAFFEPISALTGTGFNITPFYKPWAPLGVFIIAILMSAGGHTNSTSGGFKQLRIYMIFKSVIWYIQEQFLPKRAVVKRYIFKYENKAFIKPEYIRETFNYIIVYILTLVIGSAILMGYGYPVQDSFFEFSSALGTVGLSYGITGFDAPKGVLITEILGMFLGRLEFFVIFFCIIKVIRDIKSFFAQDKIKSLTVEK